MRDDEPKQQVVAESGPIGQRQERAEHCSIERQHVERANTENYAQRKRSESHANIVGKNLG